MDDIQGLGKSLPRNSAGVDDSQYRLMVETVTDYAIFLIDPNGFVRTWNLGAQLMKGYTAEEIIGQHFSVFYPQDLIDRDWPAYELQMAKEHGRFEDEGWRLRKDGTELWANIVITRLTDSTGAVIGFSKITRDLTERRRQQELLRNSEERFRLLVENVKDYAIFLLDPDGYIASWNAGAQLTKGYSAAEIIGKHFSIFYPEDVIASDWPNQELAIALKDGRLEDEGWRVRKDGSRFWASVVITALFDAGGVHRGFAKITRDLTEKRKINALEDEGRRITNFLAMLGHELRNPLAPISNALAVLLTGEIEASQERSLHEIIARQVGLMSRLVDDLRDVGRIISGKVHLNLEPMNLREAAMVAVEAVTPLMQEKSHVLTTNVKDELWVNGDHTRVVQILVNLLVNAAKFTPTGGHILLTIGQNGDKAEISVRDNGQGISPQLLPHIFKLFFQGEQEISRSHGGLGLGLSLVWELVNLHGGELAVFSTGQPRAGSEFIFKLPMIAAPIKYIHAMSAMGAGQKQRILVVDDNRDAANTMGLLLEALGYVTDIVYDGNEALKSVRNNKPNLVFLDIGLPDLNGLEVAERIVNETVDPPLLIAVTGYGQDSDRTASSNAGFYAHLTKPVKLNDLTALLKKIFE